MDLSRLENALDEQSKAEIRMADTVLSQLDYYREDIKKLADYCSDLVDSKGNKVAVGNYKIGLFKTSKFDWQGETDGIVYLNMLEGRIAIDIRDTSHDLENIEYGIDIKGPALPVELDSNMLSDCIADDSNFEMAMQATNPNTLVELVIKNSKKQVDNINNRISQFNNF